LKQLTHIHSCEEIIKKSTFITIVAPILSVQEAKDFLTEHSDLGATHNCWAYKIGQIYRFTDNGEPSGTAGKPMYNAIDGQEFDNTVALSIRHYGGIKLGTGGLMRAYGGGVSRCLQSAKFEIIQDISEITLNVPFSYIQSIHNLSTSFKAQILSEDFNETGAIMVISMLSKNTEEFIKKSINASKGIISEIKHP
jgi:uncharacterized YigZ family protein